MKTDINKIEQYFQWWLNEMVDNGYVQRYIREPESIRVLNTATYGRLKRFKSKEKIVEEFNIFGKIDYTYDYLIIWDKKAEYLFYEEVLPSQVFQFGKPIFIAHKTNLQMGTEAKDIMLDQIVSYVDVKPTNSVMQRGGKVSSAVSFPLKQRMIWDNYKKYINKVVPMPMAGTGYSSALFIKSFIPQRYLLTDGGKQLRKIKYKITSLPEYIRVKTAYINNLLKNTK